MTKFASLIGFTLTLWPFAVSAEPRQNSKREAAAAAKPTPGSTPEHKRKPVDKRAFSADAARGGVLLFRSQADDAAWLAPQVSNDVDLHVTGMIARAKVEQVFENPSDEVVEAVYVFPLPETAAVDGLTLEVGERRIVGEIREREAARETFERAKSEGKKASLIEQERPNLFTTSVANIGPGELVTVELSYQQDVKYEGGHFSILFPSTVTPRYIPGVAATEVHGFNGLGWGNATTLVPDAPRITPPVILEGGPTLDISVTIDAGFPLASVTSPSHLIDVTKAAAAPVSVRLRHDEIADRDFELDWAPSPDRAPRSALFEEEFDGERYAMLMLLPPDPSLDAAGRIARESIFVIDTSGSMSGTSIEQAREALASGLAQLQKGDTFNVVEFNSTAQRLFPEPQPVTTANVERARGWVQKLEADGGTEMLSALTLALDASTASERVRQIVFITDGSVGNESELLQFIQGHLGRQRLFTVAIGSAPNQYFMRGAARFGRGTFTHVADTARVQSVMNDLWTKIEAPVMSDLELSWKDSRFSETWPERLPDLYRGEPLVVLAKLDKGTSAAGLLGRRGGREFRVDLPLGAAASATASKRERGLHRLWARRKIEGLMDRLVEGASEEEVKPLVTALALQHHLMSKYTSLVAVDKTRTVDAPGRSVAVANALPAGNEMFGNLPQTATPGPTCLWLGFLSLSLAGALSLRKKASS